MFNLETAAEVSAYFLSKNGGTMEKVKLNKLMYLTERELVLSYGTTLTDDLMYSHNFGPVLEKSNSFFSNGPKNTYEQKVWLKWFCAFDKNNKNLSLNVNVFGEEFNNKFNNLFKLARRIMDKLYDEYGFLSYKEIISLTHNNKIYPEWKKPTKYDISVKELCLLHGKTDSETQGIVDSIERNREMAQAMEELANYDREI